MLHVLRILADDWTFHSDPSVLGGQRGERMEHVESKLDLEVKKLSHARLFNYIKEIEEFRQ